MNERIMRKMQETFFEFGFSLIYYETGGGELKMLKEKYMYI